MVNPITEPLALPLKFLIVREVVGPPRNGREGYTLGRFFFSDGLDDPKIFTLEDQDRRLEEGNPKIPGRSAMPLGQYELTLYESPTKGLVPLFHNVPNFTYCEIHGANKAEQLLGCVAVGMRQEIDGVSHCALALALIVTRMKAAAKANRKVLCTIARG